MSLGQHGSRFLDCGGKRLDLSRPAVMGILNVTPDSFSDGGDFISASQAIDRAHRMMEEGADLIDVGGESTRPGADEVSAAQELDRILPVVEALASLPVPVSVDTTKAEVMTQAARAGAGLINDVLGLRAEGALEAAAATGLPVCLMHMQGTPRTMQQDPRYDDVVAEVKAFLAERAQVCRDAGIPEEKILVDPGFGFGKNLFHNCRLLRELREITGLGLPVLVGLSRKSMIGKILGKPVDQRLPASLAAAVIAVWEGASIVRVHDVAETVDAVAFAHTVRSY